MVTDAGDQHVHKFWHNLAPTNSLALVVKKTVVMVVLLFMVMDIHCMFKICICNAIWELDIYPSAKISVPPWQQLAPSRHVWEGIVTGPLGPECKNWLNLSDLVMWFAWGNFYFPTDFNQILRSQIKFKINVVDIWPWAGFPVLSAILPWFPVAHAQTPFSCTSKFSAYTDRWAVSYI